MSRAGKFIPGGGAAKPSGGAGSTGQRTGPIRAPEPGAPAPETPAAGKKPLGKGLVKPVSKNQRVPIMIMSAVVCCCLVSFAWYECAVLPAQRAMAAAQQSAADAQKKLADAQADFQRQQAEMLQHNNALRATLIVDTKPPGATVTVGDEHKPAPVTFDDLPPGKISLLIHADGYEDYKQDVTVTVDKPTDLGTIELVLKAGSLALTSPQNEVEYNLTGPSGYAHQGQIPDKLDQLPMGNYQLAVWQHDWKLPPVTIAIHDQENVVKDIKFPYATVTITSSPTGATVRQGRDVLGQTPLTLSSLRPGDLSLSVDLVPYAVQRFTLTVPDFGNITKAVTLKQEKNFVAACGMPMMWIPDGEFWAGKYDVDQAQYETVAGTNPSFFRRPNRPVEQITWEAASAFCDKLTQYERKEGKLPAGYVYSLPSESQWALFSADANIELAPMSRIDTLSSTQDVGSSEPNKYGLYDTLGNVWEWCTDTYDDKGSHSLRGGSWLSSSDHFPSADTRAAGAPKYSDRFTGFRVVLVPQ